MNPELNPPDMGNERSLLTEREREIIAGDADVTDNYRYKVESTARQRVRRLGPDIKVLREHLPDAYEELVNVVCSDETEGDV